MMLSRAFHAYFAVLSIAVAACGGTDADPSVELPVEETTGAEDELKSAAFSGTYAPVSDDDEQHYSGVRIERAGSKLTLHLDEFGTDLPFKLSKTRSGTYVFTSGDLDGECDDPGCSYITKVSGVVYLKQYAKKAAKVPTVKLNVRSFYPYPEYDGDLEGESSTTLHWKKR